MSFQQPTETNELRETDLPVNLKTNACVSASDVFRLNQTNNDLMKIPLSFNKQRDVWKTNKQ